MEKDNNKGGMMSVIAALGANVLVAISKFVGFAVSGSAAMLNESIHSIVDCGNEILLLVGNKQAEAEQTDQHPFGQARAKYFYSMVVAMMLFSRYHGGYGKAVSSRAQCGEHMVSHGYSRLRIDSGKYQPARCLQGNQRTKQRQSAPLSLLEREPS